MDTPSDTAPARRRARLPILVSAAVVVVVIAGAVWYLFIRDDAPPAFDLDTASGLVDGATSAVDGAAAPFDGDVTGTWDVTTEPVAEEGASTAGFRVAEELRTVGQTEAVGRTEEVTGSLTIDDTTVTAAQVVVDTTSLQTDESRRDGKMRAALETDQFPTATFELTEPIALDHVPGDRDPISVSAVGDLTIKGVTRRVEATIEAQLVDGILVVVGSIPIVLDDYGIDRPTASIVLSIAPEGLVEFQLFFTKV